MERPADGLGMTPRAASGTSKTAFTRTLHGTDLEIGQMVPATSMVDAASGADVSLWDLRQRFAAAVCFLHSGCTPCLLYARSLRGFARELHEYDSLAVLVFPEEMDLESPVWVDRDGHARARLLSPEAPLPAILIVDRYGAAAGSFPSRGHSFPRPEEVVAILRHIAMECPECGVSEW